MGTGERRSGTHHSHQDFLPGDGKKTPCGSFYRSYNILYRAIMWEISLPELHGGCGCYQTAEGGALLWWSRAVPETHAVEVRGIRNCGQTGCCAWSSVCLRVAKNIQHSRPSTKLIAIHQHPRIIGIISSSN